MQIKDKGKGGVSIRLDKADVSRMLDAIYLARRVARNITKGSDELKSAADVMYEAVKTFGGDSLDDNGELRPTVAQPKRDAAEAPAGAVAP